MNRITLKIGFKKRQEAIQLILDLYSLYKETFKKNPSVDLFYSESGSLKDPVMAIVAATKPHSKQEDIDFFTQNIK